MTFYVTPMGRVARRRATPTRVYRDDNWNELDYDVFVPVNVKVENEEYVITALLPGIKAEELSLQVLNDTVTLQGEFKTQEQEGEDYLVREVPTGRFYRVIRLPEKVDSDKANADLTDGLLTLRVPKAEEARPKTIKVAAHS
jgi:HSP20 family protein